MAAKTKITKPPVSTKIRKVAFEVTENQYRLIVQAGASETPVVKPGPFCKKIVLSTLQ